MSLHDHVYVIVCAFVKMILIRTWVCGYGYMRMRMRLYARLSRRYAYICEFAYACVCDCMSVYQDDMLSYVGADKREETCLCLFTMMLSHARRTWVTGYPIWLYINMLI